MRIAEGVAVLDLPASPLVGPGFIHPTLLWEEGTAILADTGYPGQLPQVKEAVAEAGVPFEALNKVIITHHDVDHLGTLAGLREALSGRLEVLCHTAERDFIEGTMPATKVAGLEANLASLPDPMRSVYESLKRFYAANRIPVDRTLEDGERLPWCGGIRVIHTPGHTPGHLCLYLERSKILIAGDLLTVQEGRLVKGPDFTDWRVDLSRASLGKLAGYDIQSVISYHGGLYRDEVNGRLTALAAEEAQKG